MSGKISGVKKGGPAVQIAAKPPLHIGLYEPEASGQYVTGV